MAGRVEMVAHHRADMLEGQVMMAGIGLVQLMVMKERVGDQRQMAGRGGRAAAATAAAPAGLSVKDKVLAQMGHALPGVAGRQAGMQHIGQHRCSPLFVCLDVYILQIPLQCILALSYSLH